MANDVMLCFLPVLCASLRTLGDETIRLEPARSRERGGGVEGTREKLSLFPCHIQYNTDAVRASRLPNTHGPNKRTALYTLYNTLYETWL